MPKSQSSISLRSWTVLSAIGLLIFLVNIDYTAVNLTLVPIAEEINADLNSLQWLLSAYVLIWAAFVIPAGRFADMYGKRNTLIVGLFIFMVGSALTGLGQTVETLIIGRVLQGFGAAIFTAPAWATIFTTASPEQQGFVMGIILSFAGFGLAAGPTIAGLIIEEISWRWIFYVNLPIGTVVITILALFSNKEALPEKKAPLDVLSVLLLASGLCLSVFAINQIEILGIKSLLLWILMGFGGLLIAFYILRDRTQDLRMIPPHFFKNKMFMSATFGQFFMAMNFSMVLILMALYLQNTLHYSSYQTGLIFISMTISMGLLSPVGGKMIDAFGIKHPMVLGTLITASGFALMSFLNQETSLYTVILALFLVGTGLGAYFTASNIAMMRSIPQEDLNVGSGVYTMFMMIGNTLSIVLATSLLVLFGRINLLSALKEAGIPLTPEQHQDLVNVIAKVEHSVSDLKDFAPDQATQLLTWVDEAFVYGFSLDMMIGTCYALIATALTLWGVKNIDSSGKTVHVPTGH